MRRFTFRRMFSREKALSNLGLKLLSVGLALSLWLYVTYRGQSEIVVDAPIEFKNVPKGMEILKQNVKKVSLNVRGHERMLMSLRPMDVRVTVDLTGAKTGEDTYNIDKNSVVIPRSVQVLRIDPASVKVTLDESATKKVVVKPYLAGNPEKGFRVTSAVVEPSSVVIEGASSEISKIAFLRTDPIDITGLDQDTTLSARLNTNGRNIRTNVTEVTVKISIEKVEK